MDSIEPKMLIPSITNYHGEAPPTFNRTAESQRTFVQEQTVRYVLEPFVARSTKCIRVPARN